MSYKIKTRGFVSISNRISGEYASAGVLSLPWMIFDTEEAHDACNKKYLWDYFLVLNRKFSERMEKLTDMNTPLNKVDEVRLGDMFESIISTKKLWDDVNGSCEE
ncbi:MAG: hypothetical protein WAV11_02650 [Minisyncoccia bacterium]